MLLINNHRVYRVAAIILPACTSFIVRMAVAGNDMQTFAQVLKIKKQNTEIFIMNCLLLTSLYAKNNLIQMPSS